MRVLKRKKEIESFLLRLGKRGRGVDEEVLSDVGRIIKAVRRRGDAALKDFTRRLDGHERISISRRLLDSLAAKADVELVRALEFSAGRIRAFHERQAHKSWFLEEGGARLGQVIRPLERVGVYVPGGKASYPSSVLMNVIPAQVAGVREIAVAVPSPGGLLNPAVMAAIRLLGIGEVYSIGGAQAIAAFAYGTRTVRKVDKIVGPGNIYVAMAKKLVFGEVDIDMIAGPSEILIIADSSARPDFIAADMLSQAEHDELASPVLVTDSGALALEVMNEIKRQLDGLSRKPVARKALEKWGAIILTKDLEEAVKIANLIAPEHLEIMTKRPEAVLKGVKNAGAVFLGNWSPEPLGDYAAGPNHVLPTGGTARFFSPLGVYDFLKHTSYLKFSKEGFTKISRAARTIAEAEGLTAHAKAMAIRENGTSRRGK
ncbi:MAG: histidinol dehydrogenase [Nitrospiraceae bacterium]|nr:histidinol dehydrogenase [Nitrospiraceae bacterium]